MRTPLPGSRVQQTATFKKMLDNLLASLDTAVSLGCSDGDDFAIGGKQSKRRHVEGGCS